MKILKETDKAILIVDGIQEKWLPKSHITLTDDYLAVPQWLMSETTEGWIIGKKIVFPRTPKGAKEWGIESPIVDYLKKAGEEVFEKDFNFFD